MIDLEKFADSVGLARDYIDADGKYTVISSESRMATLQAMGYDLSDDAKLTERMLAEEIQPYKDIIDPVTVIREGERPFILIRTKDQLSPEATVQWELTLEDGTKYTGNELLSDIEIADYDTVQGCVYDTHRFILPLELMFAEATAPKAATAATASAADTATLFKLADDCYLPFGYHQFKVRIVDGKDTYDSIEQLLILTPLKCYAPEVMRKGKKLWGVSIQLYALRSRNNWGVGDFNDLKQLLKIVHKRGGEFVGLNPLHAGYPANPDPAMTSPYSPSSRRWLNTVYVPWYC